MCTYVTLKKFYALGNLGSDPNSLTFSTRLNFLNAIFISIECNIHNAECNSYVFYSFRPARCFVCSTTSLFSGIEQTLYLFFPQFRNRSITETLKTVETHRKKQKRIQSDYLARTSVASLFSEDIEKIYTFFPFEIFFQSRFCWKDTFLARILKIDLVTRAVSV